MTDIDLSSQHRDAKSFFNWITRLNVDIMHLHRHD
jgi:hypothetical protein